MSCSTLKHSHQWYLSTTIRYSQGQGASHFENTSSVQYDINIKSVFHQYMNYCSRAFQIWRHDWKLGTDWTWILIVIWSFSVIVTAYSVSFIIQSVFVSTEVPLSQGAFGLLPLLRKKRKSVAPNWNSENGKIVYTSEGSFNTFKCSTFSLCRSYFKFFLIFRSHEGVYSEA